VGSTHVVCDHSPGPGKSRTPEGSDLWMGRTSSGEMVRDGPPKRTVGARAVGLVTGAWRAALRDWGMRPVPWPLCRLGSEGRRAVHDGHGEQGPIAVGRGRWYSPANVGSGSWPGERRGSDDNETLE